MPVSACITDAGGSSLRSAYTRSTSSALTRERWSNHVSHTAINTPETKEHAHHDERDDVARIEGSTLCPVLDLRRLGPDLLLARQRHRHAGLLVTEERSRRM